MRWEWCVIIYPTDKTPKTIAGYYTLEQLEKEQDLVFYTMGAMPHSLKKSIEKALV